MNSVVGRSAYGPARPYGVIEHTIRPGCASRQPCGSNCDGGEAVDHDVGAGDEVLDLRVAGTTDDRAHAVVQELEQRAAVLGVDLAPPADHARHGSPPGGSTFTDVGARVGEQARSSSRRGSRS